MAEVMVGFTALGLAALEWWHHLVSPQPRPWFFSILAGGLVLWSCLRIRRTVGNLRNVCRGRDGERIAGESLEKLRKHGYEVFHDLVAGNFNIDHVVIGPSGIYAIETKTLSKCGGAEERAETDGESVFIKGSPLPDNPVPQAKGNARWLTDYLYSTTAMRFPVIPVILLPGWYVTSRAKPSELLLLNEHENSLKAWIVDNANTLSKADQALISSRLSLFLRG
jgi:hypothetical protein